MRYFNRNSRDYNFAEKFEAGLVLSGADAKALRVSGAQFNGAKVEIINGVPTVFNLTVTPYKFAQNKESDKTTERKLLLTKKEIAKLQSLRHQKYMLIPISIFTKGRWFKMEVGVGRKMKKYEKREKIRARENME
ncbi:SsrA-binding protein [Candidatus Shapirobacteria bacterium CG_4_8_14_3_um_filter_35_11]|uniref:SsrA-binding protein n=4 Tax=Candidatus Shapironibacteriota TaxID=1752721 RepID=A0A2M7XNR0_9BACT|nr:MAG: SsrA-binding protein [Candidatus Shapirobacteria bacterium CG03_land_8_20_14_0_80_35_14]PJA51218.1 MAG: SsrA-binding protein [Candidatus Shapirobacteria bacterium CG_4_9_14_3_um_filter_36_12]PJC81111.1 MAG: SsrA-binding protein [Candidatus Shapirobacteria bacterium CG_4_8_14_3_um_filter_35_11]PJE66651.1 MAG: SsrA-binding protein [Candidatus Shapirobacteria bacterium CG10_big_fil_rev_8_21_14_0_10_36_6]